MNHTINKTQLRNGLIILVALLILYFIIHHFTKKPANTIPPPPVVVQKPVIKDMVEYITQTGTTVAYNSVDLVARVKGYLDAIEFSDGSMVKKGQNLFVIEPQPYLEQLKAAQADVAASKASYAYTKSEYARQQRMYKENATSLNSVEEWLAKTEERKAEIDKAVANEEIAAINYSYTHITSPFAGRIGRHMVDIGNLVGNGVATVLATVQQIDPLYVYFNLNELDLIKLREAARAQGFKPSDIKQITAQVSLQDASIEHSAQLDFVNTGLNASTGTMEFRALLPNKDALFVPGLFVQVKVPVTKPAKQLTVPSTAILYDQIGAYLLLVDANNVVVMKHVTLGSVENDLTAVTKGISAEDNVIIDGLQFATPGEKVAPQTPNEKNTTEK